jgi:hypothetical protein
MRALYLVPLLVACQNAGQDRPLSSAPTPPAATPAPTPAPPPTTAPTPTSPPTAVPTAVPTPANPMPALADLTTISLRLHQGGPSKPACGGVVSELVVDLAKNKWTRSFCTDENKLDKRSGALTPENRALIEREWAKLTRKPGPSCASDAGRLDLAITPKTGAKQAFVGPGTSCSTNPPEVADGLDEFYSQAFTITR